MQFRFILFIALSILVSLFAILNADVMTLYLVFASYEISGSIVILASVMAGALLVVLFGLGRSFKSLLRNKEVKRQIALLKKESDDNALSAKKWQEKYETIAKELDAMKKSSEVQPINQI